MTTGRQAKGETAAMRTATYHSGSSSAAKRPLARWFAMLVLVALFAGCTPRDDRYRQHLSRGKTLFEREDFEKAGVEFRNALQVAPGKAEAHYWVGRYSEATRQWQQAFGAYLKSLKQDPEYLASQRRLARLYLMVRDLPRAEMRLAEILGPHPDDPEGRALAAMLLAARGQFARAEQEAAQVLERAPGNPEATALVVEQLLRQQELGRARALLEREITANPRSIELRMLYGTVLARLNETRRLEENHRNLVELAPRRFDLRMAQAAFHARSGRPDRAEEVLRDAIEANADDEARPVALVDFLLSQRGQEVAAAELNGMIQRRPRAHGLKLKLAQLDESAGRAAAAEGLLRKVMLLDKGGAASAQARVQLAALMQRAGRSEEALQVLDELLRESPRDARGLQMRARLALGKGDHAMAIADLRTLLRDQPGSAGVIALLASAHRQAGEAATAKEVIGNAIERFPHNGDLRLIAAEFLLAVDDEPAAVRTLDALIAREPRNVRAYELKGAIQSRAREHGAAAATFTALKVMAPESPSGPYRLAHALLAQQRPDAAVRELELALWRSADVGEYLTELIALYTRHGWLDQGIARARAVVQREPENARPLVVLGHLYLAQTRLAEAERAFVQAREVGGMQVGPVLGLSRVHVQRGNAAQALAVLEDARASLGGETLLLIAIAELYQRTGAEERAIVEYEALLARVPGNDLVANNLAWLLAEHRGTVADLDRALEIARRFEGAVNPSFLDTLGWIRVKRGENDLAIPILQRARERAPNAIAPMYHLGVALLKAGRADEGRQLLRRVLQSAEPFDRRDEARRLLAQG